MCAVNQELTFNYMNKIFKENEIEINETKMKTLDIVNKDNVYTNLAVLLSDQCVHTIGCISRNGYVCIQKQI